MSQHKENEFKLPAADVAPVVEALNGFDCAITMERLISPWADKTGFSSEKEDLKTWLKAGGGKVYPATGEAIGNGSRKTQRNNNLRLALQYCNNPEEQEKEQKISGKNVKRIFWIQKAQHSKALASRINNLASQIIQSDPELTKKEKENLRKRLINKLRVASDPPAVSQTTSSSEKQDSKDDATQAALPEVNNKAGIIKTPSGFVCPLTGDLMKEPYLAADGYSYEKKAIEEHLQKSNVSPVTGEKLENKNLVKNWNLFKAIQDFQAKWMPFSQHQQMIARVEKEASDIRAKRAQQKELRKVTPSVISNPEEEKNVPISEVILGLDEEATGEELAKPLAALSQSPKPQQGITTTAGSIRSVEQKSPNENLTGSVSVAQLKAAVEDGDLITIEKLLKERAIVGLKFTDCHEILLDATVKDCRIFQFLLDSNSFLSVLIPRWKYLGTQLLEAIGTISPWSMKEKERIFAKLARYIDVPWLLQAACLGNIKLIKKRMGDARHHSFGMGTTVFEHACANGHVGIMELFRKVDSQVVNKKGVAINMTPLMLAVKNSQLGAISYLLDHGAKIEKTTAIMSNPLIEAINQNSLNATKLLLERGAFLADDLEDILSMLLMRKSGCVEADENADAVRKLLSVSFSDDAAMILLVHDYWVTLTKKSMQNSGLLYAHEIDADGNTTLMLDALQGNADNISLHLRAGGVLEKSNKRRQTPLLLAAYGGNARVVGLLLDAGADICATDMAGMSVLMAAVSSGKIEVVEVLLKWIVASKREVDPLLICFPAALAKVTNQPAMVELFAEFAGSFAVASSQSSTPQNDVLAAVSSLSVAEQKHVKQGNDACLLMSNRSSFFIPPQHQQANRKESKEMLQPQFLQKDATQELQAVKDSSSSSGEVMYSSMSEHH